MTSRLGVIYLVGILTLSALGFPVAWAQAQSLPQNFTVEGRLYDSTGAALNSSAVDIMLSVLNQGSSCVLYRETYSNLDVSSSNADSQGVFSLRLGSAPTVDFPVAGGGTLSSLFINGQTFNGESSCSSPTASGDHRVVRIKVKLSASATTAWETLSPDTYITPVPAAMVAENAQTLQGKSASSFLLTNTTSGLNQTNAENLFSNFTALMALIGGSSTQYIKSSPTASVSLNGQTLTNIGTPVAATDAANKSYADNNVGGKTVDVTGVGVGVGGGKILVWDQALNKWSAQSANGVSNLIAGTGLIGGTITVSGTLSVDVGTTAGKIVQLNAQGKLPALDGSLLANLTFPVTSVNGKSGVVTLNAVDLGLGTAATQNYGNAANNLVQLNASAQLPAVDGSLLTNINTTKIQSRSIAATAPTSGQVLTWNSTNSVWEPRNAAVSGITDLTGDVSASGSGSVSATIANSAITSAKINASGYAINRILITDSTNPNLVTYANCANGEILKYGPTGWLCAADAGGGTLSLVSPGAGLVAGDITSTGTLNVDIGTGANKVLAVSASGQYPALDGNLITNINAVKIQSRNIASIAPAGGQALMWNSSTAQWEPTSLAGSGTVTQLIAGVGLVGTTISTSGSISVDVGTTANKIVQLNSTAQLVVGAGNAVAPSYTFSNFTSTGLFATSGAVLGFSVNGSERMRINQSGSVGIGTTGPQDLLQVAGGVRSTGAASGNVASSSGFDYSSGLTRLISWGATSSSYSPIAFWQMNSTSTATFERMRIDTSGNVGIGTTTPTVALDVNGTGTFSAIVVPRDTTANRNPNPMNGMIRYNTNLNKFEAYEGGAWTNMIGSGVGGITSLVTGAGLSPLTITSSGTLSVDVGTSANKILQVSAGGQYPALDGSALFNVNASRIQQRQISASAPAAGQVLGWNNSSVQWEPVNAGLGTVTGIVAGPGLIAGTVTSWGTAAVDVGTAANKIVQLNANAQLGLSAGNLGAPSYSFAANTTTGMYNPGANDLSLATGGVDRIYVSNVTGNVGIGTSIPAARLNVGVLDANNGGVTNALLLDHTTTGAAAPNLGVAMSMRLQDTSGSVVTAGQILAVSSNTTSGSFDSYLAFRNSSSSTVSEKMRLDAAGRLGIGTNSPQTSLDVNGSGTLSAMLIPRDTLANRPIGINGMLRYNSTNAKFEAYEGGVWTNMIGSGGGVTSLIAGPGLSPLTITSSGTISVDIGTAANKILQVTAGGQYPAVDGALITNLNAVKLQSRSISSTAPTTNQVLTWNNISNQWEPQAQQPSANSFINGGNAFGSNANLGTTDFTNLNFMANNNVQMTLNANGNVGIGTVSPAANLEVISSGNGNNTVANFLEPSVSIGNFAQLRVGAKSANNNSLEFRFYNAFGSGNAGNYGALALYGQASPTLVFNGSGNVGVGTTSPAAALDVVSSALFSAIIVPRATTANRPAGVNGMIRYNIDNAKFEAYENGSWTSVINSIVGSPFVNGGNAFGANASLGTTDVTNLNLLTCNNVQMTVTSRGDVGIGTLMPAARLDVLGVTQLTSGSGTGSALNVRAASGQSASLVKILGASGGQIGGVSSTGNYQAPFGSAGNPSFSFYSDPTTGIFAPTNFVLGFSTNGAERMRIDSLGDIGIGTVAPAAALDVYSTGTLSAIVVPRATTVNRPTPINGMIRYNTNNAKFEAFENGGWVNMIGGGSSGFTNGGNAFGSTANLGTMDVTNLNVLTNNNVQMTVTSKGNVGIGTSSPAARLDVSNTSNTGWVNSAVFRTTFSGLNGANQIDLENFGTAPSKSNAINFSKNGIAQWTIQNDQGSSGGSDFEIVDASVSANRLVIDSNGNVAIGNTLTPTSRLDVVGGISAGTYAGVNAAPANGMIIDGNVGIGPGFGTLPPSMPLDVSTTTTGFQIPLQLRNTAAATVNTGTQMVFSANRATGGLTQIAGIGGKITNIGNSTYQGALIFSTSNASSPTERMRIDSAGSIGIGTTSPLAALDVNVTGTNSAIIVPRDTTANRPGGTNLVNGMIRYNTITNKFEFYENGAWVNPANSGSAFINGGNTFGAGATIGTKDSYNISLMANNNSLLTLTAVGNIGVGTATPSTRFHVMAASGGSPGLLVSNSDWGASIGSGLAISTTGTSGNTASMVQALNNGMNGTGAVLSLNPSGGNVGVGTTSPRATMDVNGTIVSGPANYATGSTIDFSLKNLQYTTNSCGAFQLNNLRDGGTYSFAVQGAASATCSFTAFSDTGVTPLTVHMPPNHGATVAGYHTLYSMMVIGTHVYISWTPGY